MGSGLQPLRLLLQDGRMLDLTGSATMGRDSVGEVVKSESLPCKFAKFSSFVGMPLAGFKEEISSLLREMEARKGRGVKFSGGKRKTISSSRVEREIRKLECFVNCNSCPI